MGAVTTLVATVAVAAGGVALYRFIDRQTRQFKDAIKEARGRDGAIIDYERDPDSGVYKPKH